MRVLAFDTTMAACSVALWSDGTTEAFFCAPMMHGQAEALMPAIEQVMAEAGQDYQGVDRIAVTTGPGSFTGVRVGLATARGLGLAAGRPVVGVLTTEVLAADARQSNPQRTVIAAIDARRAEVYVHCFNGAGQPLDEPQCLLPEAAAQYVSQLAGPASDWCLSGDGAERLTQALQTDHTMVGPDYADARVLAAVAAERSTPDHAPRPVYVRPPDAVQPKSGGRLRP